MEGCGRCSNSTYSYWYEVDFSTAPVRSVQFFGLEYGNVCSCDRPDIDQMKLVKSFTTFDVLLFNEVGGCFAM